MILPSPCQAEAYIHLYCAVHNFAPGSFPASLPATMKMTLRVGVTPRWTRRLRPPLPNAA